MRLLAAARDGELGPSMPLSKDVANFVRCAGLLIASATAISPIAWRYPFAPTISHSLRDGVLQYDSVSLDQCGVISDQMRWMTRMGRGFTALRKAELAAQRDGADNTARCLKALLVRFNLLFAIFEAVRSAEDNEAIVEMAAIRLGTVRRDFVAYGIWPPETVGRALARRRLLQCISSPEEAASGAKCIEAAGLLMREAAPLAVRARQAVRFDELLATAQEVLPVYWAAVILFYQAMGFEKPFPKDALRDFRVIEEYRVGTLELFSQLGSHLIWRPALFLRSGPKPGTPLREAMRAALLAARAEISIYPGVMHAIWDEAAEAIGAELPLPDDFGRRVDLELDLTARADSAMSKVFADPETVEAARSLRWIDDGEIVKLAPSWRDCVWSDLDPLIPEPDKAISTEAPGTRFTTTEPRIPAREILEALFGRPWPSDDSVRDEHL